MGTIVERTPRSGAPPHAPRPSKIRRVTDFFDTDAQRAFFVGGGGDGHPPTNMNFDARETRFGWPGRACIPMQAHCWDAATVANSRPVASL